LLPGSKVVCRLGDVAPRRSTPATNKRKERVESDAVQAELPPAKRRERGAGKAMMELVSQRCGAFGVTTLQHINALKRWIGGQNEEDLEGYVAFLANTQDGDLATFFEDVLKA
jgi:hypothetical protein